MSLEAVVLPVCGAILETTGQQAEIPRRTREPTLQTAVVAGRAEEHPEELLAALAERPAEETRTRLAVLVML